MRNKKKDVRHRFVSKSLEGEPMVSLGKRIQKDTFAREKQEENTVTTTPPTIP